MLLVSPHCHYHPLHSGVKIIWLIAVNSLFCYCQQTALIFCQKAGMCAKQEDLGLALSPLHVTPFPFPSAPLPFRSPSPLLPFPSPFLSVLCLGQQNSCFSSVILENSDCRPINLYLLYICIVYMYLYNSISYQPV